jgi:hypothetical protein
MHPVAHPLLGRQASLDLGYVLARAWPRTAEGKHGEVGGGHASAGYGVGVRLLLIGLVIAGGMGAAVTLRVHHRDRERAHRRVLVRRLESRVTVYAREKVGTHELDGPILRTKCLPFDVLDQDDLRVHRGRYSCVAVTEENRFNYSGHTFIGLIDYGSGRIRFYRTGIPSYLGI